MGEFKDPVTAAERRRFSGAGGWLIVILLASLALRVAFSLFWPISVEWSDARGYHLWALSLLHNGTFPSAFRPPGYPAFVAAIYAVFGERQLPVMLIQSVLSTLGVWLTYLLAVEILGPRRRGLALLAAALFGLSPGVAFFSGWLLREAVATFLIPLSAWLCLRLLTRSWRYALGLGLAGCALAYIRMETGLFIATMLAAALLDRRWRLRALGGGALAGLIVAAGTAPWIVHCARTRGYASMQVCLDANLFARTWHLSPTGAAEPELRARVLERVKSHGLSAKDQRTWTVAGLLTAELPPGDTHAEVALYRQMGAIARENLRHHFLGYLATFPVELWRTMGGEPFRWWPGPWMASIAISLRDRLWNHLALKALDYFVWPAAVISLASVALVWAIRRRDRAAWPLTLTVFAVAVSVIAMTAVNSQGQAHLRVPYDCVLYIAAAFGAAVALRKVEPVSAEK